jgi:8-oxo-dGTP pyrophosphatase MutT (NUDIX family)
MPEIGGAIVEAVLFRRGGAAREYLLLRRAARETVYPGLWQIITGTLHEGESALTGAGREVREETGLQPGRFWVVPHISAFYDHTRDYITLIPFFAGEVEPGSDPLLSHEHDAWVWLPYPEAREKLVWPSQKEGLRIVEESIAEAGPAAGLVEVPFPRSEE